MNSFFWSQGQQKDETVLILVVECGKVEGAIVTFGDKVKPEIRYHHREYIDYLHEVSADRLLSLSVAALKRACETIASEGLAEMKKINRWTRIARVEIFLGSLWHRSEKKVSVLKRDKEFIIDENALLEACKSSEPEHAHEKLIEKRISEVRAKGYVLKDLAGKRSSEIEVEIYQSFADNDTVKEIKNIIEMSFGHRPQKLHTLPIACYSASLETVGEGDYLLILPEHEITDIILVKGQAILENITLPFGRNFLIRALAEKTNRSFDTAYSLFKVWAEEDMETRKADELDKILFEPISKMKDMLRNALWGVEGTVLLPQKFVIWDRSTASKFMWLAIAEDEYIRQEMAADSVKPVFADEIGIYNLLGYSKNMADISEFMAGAIIYLDRNATVDPIHVKGVLAPSMTKS